MPLVSSPEHIRASMSRILAPGQVVELRALHVPTSGGPRTFSGFFTDVDAFAQAAAQFSDMGARGVYFTPNPLKPDLLGSMANTASPATRGSLAKDIDVTGIRWL